MMKVLGWCPYGEKIQTLPRSLRTLFIVILLILYTVSSIRNSLLEDQELRVEDFLDGMVLTSMSRNLLSIQWRCNTQIRKESQFYEMAIYTTWLTSRSRYLHGLKRQTTTWDLSRYIHFIDTSDLKGTLRDID